MDQIKLFERTGYVIAGVSLLVSWLLFYSENGVFVGSFFAAVLAAGLFWMTYIMLRLVWMTFRKK